MVVKIQRIIIAYNFQDKSYKDIPFTNYGYNPYIDIHRYTETLGSF